MNEQVEAYRYEEAHPNQTISVAWLDGYITGANAKAKKKELDLSFVPSLFQNVVQVWMHYKIEKKQKYTQSGIEQCVKRLIKISNGNVQVAEAIVSQSMANNWAGLFELKNERNNTKPDPRIFGAADAVLQEYKQ